MDGRAWKAAVHGVAEGRTWLNDFIFTFHFHALEKEMVTYPSVLAWRIPGMGEPGGLPSKGSHRVGHNWSDLAAWNLERWYWFSYLWGSKGDTDVKNRLMATLGQGEGGMTWESSIQTYILPYVKHIVGGNLLYDVGNPKLLFCDNLEG